MKGSTLAKILVLVVASSTATWGQDRFPSKPVEIIVTFGSGGGADQMARQISKIAAPILGVPVTVTNVPGASGNAGLNKVLGAAPEGYTVGTLIALTVSAWAMEIGSARPDDFTILTVIQDSPSMLFVAENSPFKTFQDFLAHAKSNPGKLKVATAGYGTQDDITLRYLASLGYKMSHVPFAKPDERYASLANGHTDALYEEPGDVAQFIRSTQFRPLVVFDDERHRSFAEVPTSKELGMDINDLTNFRTLAVPAKTPPDRVKTLAGAFNKVLETPEWKKYCAETFTCTRQYTPEQAKALVTDFYNRVESHLKKFADAKG